MPQKRTIRKARRRSARSETSQQTLRLTALAAVLGAGLGIDVSAATAADPAARLQKVSPNPAQSLQNKYVPSPGSVAIGVGELNPNPAKLRTIWMTPLPPAPYLGPAAPSRQQKVTPGPGTSQQHKVNPNPVSVAPTLDDPTDLMTIDKAFD